jgi:Na+/H+-dicarboxylate symporter
LAITRLDDERRVTLSGFFHAVRDAMLVLVGWMLALAPIGVFALALPLATRMGTAAFGALAFYVVLVSAMSTVFVLLVFIPQP